MKQTNNIDLVKLYIQNGAKPNIKNNKNQTPIDIAKADNKDALTKILQTK